MKLSFYDKMGFIARLPLNRNLIDRFLKKLGTILFLFQSIEEQIKNGIMTLIDIVLVNSNYSTSELSNILLARRGFRDLVFIFSYLYKFDFPSNEVRSIEEFNKLISRIDNAENERNRYIHSVYYLLPDNKIHQLKQGRSKKDMDKIIIENLDLKNMDKYIDELFNINFDLRELSYSNRDVNFNHLIKLKNKK